MMRGRAEALELLGSVDFFACLRSAARDAGLAKEEKFAVGIYFVATSRILRSPLRLRIREQTKGSANYVVRRTVKLLQPGSFVEISPGKGEAWGRFAKNPEHKTVYVTGWDKLWKTADPVRIEVAQNQLSRVVPVERDERVVEEREDIEAPFACISAEHSIAGSYASRWLTMVLDKPPTKADPVSPWTSPKGEEEFTRWHRVQELLQERAQLPVVLPEWADLVVEELCKDERVARHLPAFLQAWKTMAVFRSFLRGEKAILQRGMLEADFEDFAATGSLLRGVFREGHWFPSPAKVFNKVFPVGEECGLRLPLTGKGIRYVHRNENPVRWQNLLAWGMKYLPTRIASGKAKLRDDE